MYPSLVKILADVLVEPIKALFNRTLVYGISADWKKAEVVPHFKEGAVRDVGNYRPIHLTSVIYKAQERLVRQTMYQHMVANSILSDAQHDFVHQRPCLINMLSFLDGVI